MRNKMGLVLLSFVLCITLGFVHVGFANVDGIENAAESRIIPYPDRYVTTKEGASSYNGLGNVKQSPYYKVLDFYNLQSTDTLTLLPHYKTYQQTTEITCGPAAALTVLVHFGNTNWQEQDIAKIMNTKPAVGTDTKGMVLFFNSIGWEVKSSLTASHKDGSTFAKIGDFRDFVIDNLKTNTPILVENIDWGGHWRVIIGYDTMGTATVADDVLILADSYDTADHFQDGYVVNPVEKFYYMWFDAHMLPKGQQSQQWLVAKPR
ncbi:MAG: hypothetical protein H6Q72_377 [Firmicutes bacterium]|nr:hypothetical protein [Bacillota bacterium]